MLLVAEAFRKKISLKRIYSLSKIDPWFLGQIKEIVDNELALLKKEAFQKIIMNLIELNLLVFLTKN